MLDSPVIYVRRQLRNVDRSRIALNPADDQGLAEIFERSVYCVNEQLHCNRLTWTRQHQARAWLCHQIIRGLTEPLLIELRSAGRHLQISNHATKTCVVRPSQNLCRKRVRKRWNLARRTAKTMVCHRAREREAVLDNIKPIHVIFRRVHTPS